MQERMKNRIHYSPESRHDLDDIWDYIVSELQNRSAAEHVINRIMDTVDHLKNFGFHYRYHQQVKLFRLL